MKPEEGTMEHAIMHLRVDMLRNYAMALEALAKAMEEDDQFSENVAYGKAEAYRDIGLDLTTAQAMFNAKNQ